MKVLIVGSGGREHAIAWKVAQSPKVDKIYCAPGNAGIAEYAECVDIAAMEFDKLVAFAKEKEIDLTVIGMDDPLVGGVVDAFEAEGLRVFGPRKNAAILEGSKAFSKDLMKKYHIPTAAYETFSDPEAAEKYLETAKFPIVLKADGLALGKGVLICNTLEEAKEGVKTIMLDKKFGSAGNEMVIEEFMTGREVSVLSFVDGKTIKTMSSAQDHKRAGDGDTGLNTGGMGNFSPSPFYTEEVDKFCKKYIYQPTVDAMAAEGRPFKGVIFFGLMLTPDGPKVLEYNARFGDPEAQVVLPRMKTDIIDVFEACIDGTLDQIDLQFADNACVCIVLASNGYPVSYEKGFPIRGLETFKEHEGYYCFHAGTKFKDGEIVTNGGRVLGVTALGDPLNPDGTWGQKQRREYLLDEDGNRIRDKNGDYMFNAVHTTDWHEPETLEHWREQWAAAVNTKFEEKGLDVRIDHRSYVRQGLDLIPTVHEGANVRQMEAKGIRTEKGELNRWIKATNRLMQDVRKKIKALFVWMAEVKEELSKPQTPSLADLLIAYYNQRNAGAWSNKARTGNLKQFAEAVNYLTENKLLTLEDLQERLSSVNEEFEALSDSMKKKSARIKELQELIREGENYQRLKPVHTELNNIKFKKQREKFETSHDAELRLFYAARRILKEKLDGKPIALKAWKQEYAQLKTEYAELSPQHKPLREEVIRLRQVQNAVDTALRRREQPQAVQRKKHEMEL